MKICVTAHCVLDKPVLEVWAPVADYPDSYEVSNLGGVRSKRRQVHWRGSMVTRRATVLRQVETSCFGHLSVGLYRDGKQKQRQVHRLVLEAFVGPRPVSMECCHGDGNPANNKVGNLRWDTRKGNMSDRNRHGTSNRGDRHGAAKLTSHDVAAIRAEILSGRKLCDIATERGVSRSAISLIKSNKTWVT